MTQSCRSTGLHGAIACAYSIRVLVRYKLDSYVHMTPSLVGSENIATMTGSSNTVQTWFICYCYSFDTDCSTMEPVSLRGELILYENALTEAFEQTSSTLWTVPVNTADFKRDALKEIRIAQHWRPSTLICMIRWTYMCECAQDRPFLHTEVRGLLLMSTYVYRLIDACFTPQTDNFGFLEYHRLRESSIFP